jgi:uncharacterized membrane protein
LVRNPRRRALVRFDVTMTATETQAAAMDEVFDEPEPVGRLLTGWVLLIGGIIGLAAAFDLTYERISSLIDPEHVISCDFNPILSCGSVMVTPEASVFGFPNPLLGLMAFPIVVYTGVLLLSRTEPPRWIMLGFNLGALGGVAFVSWLIFQSVYRIGVLCPWCMVVWTVTLPIFWFTLVYNLRNGVIPIGRDWKSAVNDLLRFHGIGLVLLYGVILAIIGIEFWDYWSTLM